MLVLFEGEFGPRQTQRFIEEVLHVGHWSWDLDSGVMQWSRGLMDLLGIEPETVRPCYSEFEKCIHAEDRMAQGDIEQMLRSSIAVDGNSGSSIPADEYVGSRSRPSPSEPSRPVRTVPLESVMTSLVTARNSSFSSEANCA